MNLGEMTNVKQHAKPRARGRGKCVAQSLGTVVSMLIKYTTSNEQLYYVLWTPGSTPRRWHVKYLPAGKRSRSAARSTFRCLVAAVDGLTLDSSDTGLSSSRSSPVGSTRSSACRSLGAVRLTARRRRGPSPAR